MKKLQTFDSVCLRENHFEEEYLVFQSMGRYFKRLSGVGTVNYIYFWKSK